MPYAAKLLQDDPNKKNQNNISGSSTSFTTNLPGQTAGAGAIAPKSKTESGQYQNIQNYLGANKEQAGQMSNQIGGKVESEAKDALSAGDTYEAAKPQEIKSYTKDDVNAIYDNPTAFNAQDYSKLKSTGGYEGPKDYTQVQGYQPFADKSKKASEGIKNLSTEGGRQQLLQSTFEKPTYSGGQQKLDQVLLQNNPTTKDDFTNIANTYGDLQKYLNDKTSSVGEVVNKNVQTAQANQELFPTAEKNYIEQFMNPINERVGTVKQSITDAQGRLQADIADKGNFTQESLDLLGIQQGQDLFGEDPNTFINYDQTQVNANNVMSPEERQKYFSLMNLIGQQDPNITADGQAINPITVNKEGLVNRINTRQSEFGNSLQNAIAQTPITGVTNPDITGIKNTSDLKNYMGSLQKDINRNIAISNMDNVSDWSKDSAAKKIAQLNQRYQQLQTLLNMYGGQ